MTLDQQIENILRKKYDSGATQQDMAVAMHLSQQHVQRLLSDHKKVLGISVKTLMKMFPHASLNLYGDTVSITAPENMGSVVGVNHGTISTDCLSAVLDKVMQSDLLSADEKVKVYQVLKK